MKNAIDSEVPYKNAANRLRDAIKNTLSLAIAIIVVLVTRSSIADHYIVPTGSMEPTVLVGDRLVVDKLAYGFRIPFSSIYVSKWEEPVPGDVVVLRSPIDNQVLLKRVVAGPGDFVTVRNGRVSLNGQIQEVVENSEGVFGETIGKASHGLFLSLGGGPDYGPSSIPENKYLVMGDNRGNSYDGRLFGLVDDSAILGRAIAVFYSNRGFQWRSL